jgi:hypothetical protein
MSRDTRNDIISPSSKDGSELTMLEALGSPVVPDGDVVVVEAGLDEEEEDDGGGKKPEHFFTIWEDKMVKKYLDTKGKKKWMCLHCKKTFTGWNVTKAIMHLAKVASNNIGICRAKIPRDKLEMYQKMSVAGQKKSVRSIMIRERRDELAESHLMGAANAIISEREKKRQKRFGDAVSESSLANMGGTAKTYIQKTIHTSINIKADDIARAAIAEGIHCCGLSFSLADHPKFKNMLRCMMGVGANFKFPNRKDIGGSLLKANYSEYKGRNFVNLTMDADIYGLTVYGDGATTKKKPFVNILASGTHCPAAVLEIADCTGHMMSGGTKDAKFIAKDLFLPHLKELDPGKLLILFLLLFICITY